MAERRVVLFAREHAREFLSRAASRLRRRAPRCASALVALVFLEHVVPVGPGGELREMRHARRPVRLRRAGRCARRPRPPWRRRCRRRSRRRPASRRRARRASATTSASSTRESSPPDATRASGRAGSPALAENRNSTRSAPSRSDARRALRSATSKRAGSPARDRRTPAAHPSPSATRPPAHGRERRRRRFQLAPRLRGSRSSSARTLVATFERVHDLARPLGVREHALERPAVLALEPVDARPRRALISSSSAGIELGRLERARDDAGSSLASLCMRRGLPGHRSRSASLSAAMPPSAALAPPSARSRSVVLGRKRVVRGAQRERDALDVVEIARAARPAARPLRAAARRRRSRRAQSARLRSRARARRSSPATRSSVSRERRRALVRGLPRPRAPRPRPCRQSDRELEVVGRREQPLRFVLADDLRDLVADLAHVRRPSRGGRSRAAPTCPPSLISRAMRRRPRRRRVRNRRPPGARARPSPGRTSSVTIARLARRAAPRRRRRARRARTPARRAASSCPEPVSPREDRGAAGRTRARLARSARISRPSSRRSIAGYLTAWSLIETPQSILASRRSKKRSGAARAKRTRLGWRRIVTLAPGATSASTSPSHSRLRLRDLRIARDLDARVGGHDQRAREERVRQQRHDAERIHAAAR